jgi:hypothetical protein
MSRSVRVTELYADPFTSAKVNADAGYVDDVLICGTLSRNKREYPTAVFKRDIAKYEGKFVNCDHGRESSIDRRLGWFSGVHVAVDGKPRGRFNFLKSHPMSPRVIEALERNPALYGFSHVAHCKTRRDISTGREVIESIEEVESIDLVADPATTNGLLESRGKKMPLTVKALCEALVKHPKIKSSQVKPLKTLAEMDGMGSLDSGMDAPPADDMEPGDGVKDAFCTAIQSVVDQALDGEMEAKEALRQIKELIASHERVKGGKASPEEEPEEEEEPAEEGRRRCKAADPYTILAEGEKAGYRPTVTEAKHLSRMTPEERAVWFTEQAAKGRPTGDRPTGATRRPGAGTAGNTPAPAGATRITESKRLIPAWDE